MSNDEDFTCYLQYNCLKDYLAFTTPHVEEAVKTTILSRHKKTFAIWQTIMNDWLLKNYFNMRLPVELLGGGILPETIRDRVVFNLQKESSYQTPEILLLYAQYPKTTVPPKVYGKDTAKELVVFQKSLIDAGYDEQNQKEIYHRKEQELLFEAKMEAVGIKKEQAKAIVKKASTVNLVEQYAMLSEKLANAKNTKERRKAKKQLKAFIKLNSDQLFEHKDIVKEIHKILNQPPQKAKAQPDTSQITEKSSNQQETKAQTHVPPKKATFPNVYSYLNDRIDQVVETELKIKDKQITFKKKHHTSKTKSKTSTAKITDITVSSPQQTNIETKPLNLNEDDVSLPTGMVAKSVSFNQTDNIDELSSTFPQPFAAGLISPRLADNIHVPADIFTWTDEYLENIRERADRRIADLMIESAQRLDRFCSLAANSKDLAQLLDQSLADDRDDITFPHLSHLQQMHIF